MKHKCICLLWVCIGLVGCSSHKSSKRDFLYRQSNVHYLMENKQHLHVPPGVGLQVETEYLIPERQRGLVPPRPSLIPPE